MSHQLHVSTSYIEQLLAANEALSGLAKLLSEMPEERFRAVEVALNLALAHSVVAE